MTSDGCYFEADGQTSCSAEKFEGSLSPSSRTGLTIDSIRKPCSPLERFPHRVASSLPDVVDKTRPIRLRRLYSGKQRTDLSSIDMLTQPACMIYIQLGPKNWPDVPPTALMVMSSLLSASLPLLNV